MQGIGSFVQAVSAVTVFAVNLFMGPFCSYAQNAVSNGSLTGVITDSTGAAVPDVVVALIDEDTGARSTTKTNIGGSYLFPELAAGTYQAAFSVDKFKTTQIDGLKISVGQATNADVIMQLGDVHENLVVTTVGEVLNPTDPNPSSVVEKSSIDNLPISGRRYTDFALLTPNVIEDGEFGHLSFAGSKEARFRSSRWCPMYTAL